MQTFQLLHGDELRYYKPIIKTKPVSCKFSIAKLRRMVRDKNRVAWIGLALTIVVQAVIFSSWVGSLSERVTNTVEKVNLISAKQDTQAEKVSALPYIEANVNEIKGDVKDLKQLILQGNINSSKRGQ